MERNSRKLIKKLEQGGFKVVRIAGSHHVLKRDNKTVIVPHPKKDLPLGTVRNIYRMAGWL